jgi:hypothetical protein
MHLKGKVNEPFFEHMAIDIEMIRMIPIYEGVQSPFAIAHELGFVASTVNSIVKDSVRIKEQVRGTAMIITKNVKVQ